MTTETRDRASRDLAQLETPLRVPETVPEFLEATRPTRRRRDWLVIGAVLAAVVAGIVLLLVQPWADDTAWTGDWKDLITEEGASAEYTGDWKDLVTSDGAVDYSGDWKDLVADGRATAYTGDWKDALTG